MDHLPSAANTGPKGGLLGCGRKAHHDSVASNPPSQISTPVSTHLGHSTSEIRGSSTSSTMGVTSCTSNRNIDKPLTESSQETYSPWDMPPIIQTVPASSSGSSSSNSESRLNVGGLRGFSSNLNSSWPHFRTKPHPTISVPSTLSGSLSRSHTFDMTTPSTPPRSSSFSNTEDSDNAMYTPTFGSSYSRRNSAVSIMALDTPPPLSLMDLESSSSISGPSFGSSMPLGTSSVGHSGATHTMFKLNETGVTHGYPFPLFGGRTDMSFSISRRSSRTNSFSMDSRHVRKPSEDTNMSDGGNNSGSERSRRHSPAVVPFERSVRRSALLPKPKGLLKVFSQLEEEIHHNRHEYDHERETTQASTTRHHSPPLGPSSSRRYSASRLKPEQELSSLQKQQEEFDRVYQLPQPQHIQPFPQPQQPQPIQGTLLMSDIQGLENQASGSSFMAQQTASMVSSSPASPMLTPISTRASKRKSSTCEERFEPYNSSHLKRRAVSPSIGPIVSHRRSPSSSPARHQLASHSRSKFGSLPSPSGMGSFFRANHHPYSHPYSHSHSHPHSHPLIEAAESQSASSTAAAPTASLGHEDINLNSRTGSSSSNGSSGGESSNSTSISSTLNLQHTSRSFSELSLGLPESHTA